MFDVLQGHVSFLYSNNSCSNNRWNDKIHYDENQTLITEFTDEHLWPILLTNLTPL